MGEENDLSESKIAFGGSAHIFGKRITLGEENELSETDIFYWRLKRGLQKRSDEKAH